MLAMRKLSGGQDGCCLCCSRIALECRARGAEPGPDPVSVLFAPPSPHPPDQAKPRKWEVLTCLHLGVVRPVRDLLLADEVVYDLHPDGRFRVLPLQDHEGAAGLVHRGQPQPECREEAA